MTCCFCTNTLVIIKKTDVISQLKRQLFGNPLNASMNIIIIMNSYSDFKHYSSVDAITMRHVVVPF